MSHFPSTRRWTVSKFQVTNPMSYTADTTQPDVVDVLFFLVGAHDERGDHVSQVDCRVLAVPMNISFLGGKSALSRLFP
jgi:hypothetical protein